MAEKKERLIEIFKEILNIRQSFKDLPIIVK
jgi:hypothetical protein